MAGSGTEAEPAVRTAVFDPFSGIAGDMTVAAWLDLDEGLNRAWLLELAGRVGVDLDDARVERVRRAGLAATRVTFLPWGAGGGGEAADPHRGEREGHGRSWAQIRTLLEESRLPDRSRSLALGAFARLAAAEARVHGVPVEDVHFHEVGAADAILDVAAAADGFVRLGFEEARTLPVALGQGSVRIAHGEYPTPGPATARLLGGVAVRHVPYPYETVTPTGAAVLAELTGGGRAPREDRVVEGVGYGAGRLDPGDHPNCLRVWAVRSATGARELILLQTDVDDMSPEHLPRLVEACLEAGARDAVFHPLHMKKGRPGWRLEVLVERKFQDAVEGRVLASSTSLGVREWPVSRRVLWRQTETRVWRGHTIRVKRAVDPMRDEGRTRSVKPEDADVASAAAKEGLAVGEVVARLRQEWPDLVEPDEGDSMQER